MSIALFLHARSVDFNDIDGPPITGLYKRIGVDLDRRKFASTCGMRAPSGRHVLSGNLKSEYEYLPASGVSKLPKGFRRVSRLVSAALERPQYQTDTLSILQEVISTVHSSDPMAIMGNIG